MAEASALPNPAIRHRVEAAEAKCG